MSPKTSMKLIPSKFQTRGQSTDGLPVRVITVDSDAKLGTNKFDDDVNKAAVAAKMKEQEALECATQEWQHD
jgi:hypothetical protein